MSNVDVSGKIAFVSQFNTAFGTHERQLVACNRACKKMLTDKGFAVVNAEDRIDMAEWGENKKLERTITFEPALKLLNDVLDSGCPVIVGVNRKMIPVGNANAATSHFVVIVAREDGKYRFYDPGTSYPEKGTSKENLFALDENGFYSGYSKYYGTKGKYVMTEVRPTVV
jgi:hypothetical protein